MCESELELPAELTLMSEQRFHCRLFRSLTILIVLKTKTYPLIYIFFTVHSRLKVQSM